MIDWNQFLINLLICTPFLIGGITLLLLSIIGLIKNHVKDK